MTAADQQFAYGPVPSRRLGRSMGINAIPAKACTYSCAYCQVGRTTKMRKERCVFHEPKEIVRDVERRLREAKKASRRVDYLAFVPDGEPTLDLNLGREIALLKTLGIPVAVITNGSLLWRADVRDELCGADWVSVKVDTIREAAWRRINRPHRGLGLALILDGMREFARAFSGKLATETMLVGGLNDADDVLEETGDFLSALGPYVSFISVPLRPPAEVWVHAPEDGVVRRAHRVFQQCMKRVQDLTEYEGDDFAYSGDIERDLLGITAVHPMRENAVGALLARAGSSWSVVDRLVSRGDLAATEHDGHVYYRGMTARGRDGAAIDRGAERPGRKKRGP